jgi:hypothetical protein
LSLDSEPLAKFLRETEEKGAPNWADLIVLYHAKISSIALSKRGDSLDS